MKRAMLVVMLVVGCGSNAHKVYDQIVSIPASSSIAISVSLGGVGTIDYNVVDKTPTATADSFDLSVVAAANAAAWRGPGTVPAYSEKAGVSSASGGTPSLSAGGYAVVIGCANFVDACILGVTVTATY